MSELDYEADHYCLVFRKAICSDLCFESIMALSRSVKVESVPELKEIKDIEKARKICAECPYSDMG
jgi:hypothetical protein